jgi:hypothetical protein
VPVGHELTEVLPDLVTFDRRHVTTLWPRSGAGIVPLVHRGCVVATDG